MEIIFTGEAAAMGELAGQLRSMRENGDGRA
ncbi:uncharacterized protein G2W53_027033 [Senna tora]|uniref:Uncharacterized protein n=1 Tax=Senna tora TaxID=362788 RepID=A0A834TG12_9FABA|nr:uncharacterized protein G2W53_027033 [Senna tora]